MGPGPTDVIGLLDNLGDPRIAMDSLLSYERTSLGWWLPKLDCRHDIHVLKIVKDLVSNPQGVHISAAGAFLIEPLLQAGAVKQIRDQDGSSMWALTQLGLAGHIQTNQ